MAKRTPTQYLNSYNSIANKYLGSVTNRVDNVQSGEFLDFGGVIPILFEVSRTCIDIEITNENFANNILDKIIVTV